MVVTINGIMATRYPHQMGFEPGWTKYVHTWGEAGRVSLKKKKHSKAKDKGTTMMFVGYPDNHSPDTFNMWDSTTQRTHKTHNVIFLKRVYFAPFPILQAGEGIDYSFAPLLNSNDEDDEVEEEIDGVPNETDEDNDSIMSDDSESVPIADAREGNNVTWFGCTV
jgi:hypothetical protein